MQSESELATLFERTESAVRSALLLNAGRDVRTCRLDPSIAASAQPECRSLACIPARSLPNNASTPDEPSGAWSRDERDIPSTLAEGGSAHSAAAAGRRPAMAAHRPTDGLPLPCGGQ